MWLSILFSICQCSAKPAKINQACTPRCPTCCQWEWLPTCSCRTHFLYSQPTLWPRGEVTVALSTGFCADSKAHDYAARVFNMTSPLDQVCGVDPRGANWYAVAVQCGRWCVPTGLERTTSRLHQVIWLSVATLGQYQFFWWNAMDRNQMIGSTGTLSPKIPTKLGWLNLKIS